MASLFSVVLAKVTGVPGEDVVCESALLRLSVDGSIISGIVEKLELTCIEFVGDGEGGRWEEA